MGKKIKHISKLNIIWLLMVFSHLSNSPHTSLGKQASSALHGEACSFNFTDICRKVGIVGVSFYFLKYSIIYKMSVTSNRDKWKTITATKFHNYLWKNLGSSSYLKSWANGWFDFSRYPAYSFPIKREKYPWKMPLDFGNSFRNSEIQLLTYDQHILAQQSQGKWDFSCYCTIKIK